MSFLVRALAPIRRIADKRPPDVVITGPRVRTWGFLCKKGWVDWKTFIGAKDGGSATRGVKGPSVSCGEE